MSAQINLAPEIYQSSQRAKRNRRLATTIGTLVSAVAIGLVVIGLASVGAQKLVINSLQSAIKNDQTQIQGFADLQNAVTAADHLTTFSQLLSQRVYMSRFFSVLQDVAPQGLAVSSVSLNANNQMEVAANAKTFALATKFAKALEADNTQIGPNASPTQTPYFTNVTLSSVTSSADGGSGVDFKLTTDVSGAVISGN